jgi:hypothetical protein
LLGKTTAIGLEGGFLSKTQKIFLAWSSLKQSNDICVAKKVGKKTRTVCKGRYVAGPWLNRRLGNMLLQWLQENRQLQCKRESDAVEIIDAMLSIVRTASRSFHLCADLSISGFIEVRRKV